MAVVMGVNEIKRESMAMGNCWFPNDRSSFIAALGAPIIGLSFIPQLVNNICFCQLYKVLNIGLLFCCCLSLLDENKATSNGLL